MKIVKSSCAGKKKVRTCTFSPQVNIKNKREPIQTQNDVNAAHSEAKIRDLVEDLKNVIWTKVSNVATSDSFGFDENEVNDYFFVDVTPTEIGEDHHEAVRVEVRAEVSYEGLEELMEALNPIIESYDSYAYFEPVEPGIIEAYVSVDQVDMSVYGGSEYADSSIEDSSDDSIMFEGNNYEYVTNNHGYWIYRAVIDGKGVWRAMKQDSDESQFDNLSFPITYEQARGDDPIGEPNSIARLRKDLGKKLLPKSGQSVEAARDLVAEYLGLPKRSSNTIEGASNILAASKLTHKKFVNLLKRHFKFSEDAANIVANWYEQEDVLDNFDDIDELLNYIDDDIYDMLDASTNKEEYDIVSKYLNIDTNDGREYDEDNNRVENDPSVEDIRWAMNHLPSQFKVTGNNLSYNVAYDSHTVRVAFFLLPGAKYTYTIDGKGPYSTNQEEQINFDLQNYFDRLPITSSTDDKAFIENIEDIIDGLEDNGYDLSRIRSIRRGLLELFGYKGKDADIIIHDLVASGFLDPNDWVDKDYTPGIYSATEEGYKASENYKGRRIRLLNDGTGYAIFEKGEMIDYGFKSLEDAEAAIDEYDDIYQDDVQVYSDTAEDEEDLPMVDQEYDSAATSINSNKLSATER